MDDLVRRSEGLTEQQKDFARRMQQEYANQPPGLLPSRPEPPEGDGTGRGKGTDARGSDAPGTGPAAYRARTGGHAARIVFETAGERSAICRRIRSDLTMKMLG